MDSYLVSARKYRPQRFDELVAQSHVTETLKNAILLDRIAHAYLFSGPRGVGKTTAARILAKAINCSTPLADRDGAEPCQTCDSCRSFEGGRNLNVIEIDAASNNKVDDMRDLRDTVRIPPQGAPHKVYIIDEVHMLSQAAFNALLKTLEEPPAYALFIFATTEPHKVLATIQSRCQRFDFRRIDVDVIVEHLTGIAEREGVAIDDASLMLLARKADGALRDALSAFDQAVSLCGDKITYRELADAFRVVDVDQFFEVTRCAAERDSAGVLALVDSLVKEGYDLTEFLGGLLGHLRNLLVVVSTGGTGLIEATADVRARYAEAAEALPEPDLLRMMMVVSNTEETLKTSRQPRLNAELGLLKLVHLGRATDLNELLSKLRGSPPRPRAKPAPEAQRDSGTLAKPKRRAELSVEAPGPRQPKAVAPEAVAPEAVAPEAVAPESAPSLFGTPALKRTSGGSDADRGRGRSTEGSAAVSLGASAQTDRSSVRDVDAIWLAFVRSAKTDRIHVGSLLQHGSPLRLEAETLHVAIPDDFHRRLLTNQEQFLLDHLQAHLPGRVSRLVFSIREDLKASPDETEDTFDPLEYMNRKRVESPIVRAIFEEFGGELVW